MQNNLHPLLVQQLSELTGSSKVPHEYQLLLERISESYEKDDAYINDLEHKVSLRTEQLLSSTSQAYSFLDSLSMGFIMSDVNGEIVLTNNSAREILSARVIEKQNSGEIPKDSEIKWTMANIETLMKPQLDFKQLIAKSLATDEPVEWKELDYGKYILHLFVTALFNQQNPGSKQHIGAVILIENITQQIVLERSKDDFLSIASHELRTPLTAIRGNASLINKYYGEQLPNKDVREMIDDIHESSIRLIDIVNDFLDASSLEQGKIIMSSETFNVNEIISDVVRELHSLGSIKDLSLEADDHAVDTPNVRADKQRTKQVMINLVGNAIKYTEKGGVTISARSDEKFVYVTVTDTGNGMSEENQRLLFRKFQQAADNLLTRDTTKSTGLGLYISKLIVELSGGKLFLESSVIGKGSAFTFSLPRAERDWSKK